MLVVVKLEVLILNSQLSTLNFKRYGIYGTADCWLFERNGRGWCYVEGVGIVEDRRRASRDIDFFVESEIYTIYIYNTGVGLFGE